MVWIGISAGDCVTLCSISPFLWWPYSNFILSSPILDFGKISGIHSITKGVGSFCSGVALPAEREMWITLQMLNGVVESGSDSSDIHFSLF